MPEPDSHGLSAGAQTVCTYWLKGLCMKGDTCGFLHVFDVARMPVCRQLLKYGVCKEADCPYKHSLDDIKVRLTGPPLLLCAVGLRSVGEALFHGK